LEGLELVACVALGGVGPSTLNPGESWDGYILFDDSVVSSLAAGTYDLVIGTSLSDGLRVPVGTAGDSEIDPMAEAAVSSFVENEAVVDFASSIWAQEPDGWDMDLILDVNPRDGPSWSLIVAKPGKPVLSATMDLESGEVNVIEP
jgi:hypothetical protein